MLQGEKSNSIEVYNKYFSESKLASKKKNSILFINSRKLAECKAACRLHLTILNRRNIGIMLRKSA
jgi:hypothetical protein